MRALLSFLLLQIAWFACVLGPMRGASWLGPVVVLALLAHHLRGQAMRGREALLLVGVAAVGFAIDTALLRAGVLVMGGAGVSPPWLVALWPNFAVVTADGGSLTWLRSRPFTQAALGALGGPLAYAGGARLGAVALGAPALGSLAIIGLAWAAFVPALFAARARVLGGSAAARPEP